MVILKKFRSMLKDQAAAKEINTIQDNADQAIRGIQAGSASSVASLLPSGLVSPFAGSTAPMGWLMCDGSAVSRAQYPKLFSAIGTAFGAGDGSTTFNLPNTKGVFPRGAGSQTIGGIVYSATLGASQGDQMQGHIHSASTNAAVDNSAHGVSGGFGDYCTFGASVTIGSPVSDGTNGTPRTGAETRPANLGMNFIIKT